MTGLSQPGIARCTTCGTPLVKDKPLEDMKRIFEPYHEVVSWTYYAGQSPEKMEEALLIIRRRLKQASGWWTESDEQLERAAKERLGIERQL